MEVDAEALLEDIKKGDWGKVSERASEFPSSQKRGTDSESESKVFAVYVGGWIFFSLPRVYLTATAL
tara:strand:+ start:587 stop:787 length:201 start_codon:yes stop_codon:yes gene_type:complete